MNGRVKVSSSLGLSNSNGDLVAVQQGSSIRHRRHLILVVAFYCIFLLGVLASLRLRPANDDYWIIAEAFSGIPSSLAFWWQSWSGFATTFSLNVLVVGLPGTHLPWALVSAVPFIFTSLTVGAVLLFLLGWTTSWFGWRSAFALAPVGAVLWWTFLWGASLIGPTSPLVLGLTHWQNLNAAYVLPFSLLIAGYAWALVLGRPTRSWQRLMFVLILGLATGLAHLVISMSILVTIGIVIAVRLSTRSRRGEWSITLPAVYAVLAILVGQFIALAAPGSRVRRSAIAPEVPFSIEYAVSSTGQIIGQTVTDISTLVFAFGTVVTVGAAVLCAFVLKTRIALGSTNRLRVLFHLGLLLSLTTALVNNALELVVGFGYWHRSALAVAVFFTAGLGGAYGGALLRSIGFLKSGKPLFLLGVVVVVLSLGSTAKLYESALGRQSNWDVGPAPLSGAFDDINGPQPWITRNWQVIADSRDAPSRT